MLKKRMITMQIESDYTTSVISSVMNLLWEVMKVKPKIRCSSFGDEQIQEFVVTFVATDEKFAIVEERMERYFKYVLE